ncbi:MAG: nitroreductase family protein [Candidatus Rokubacteria bacterium]|nr:nitroreductase family protein [Candidatus Rokubacteria bacterium]
MTTSLKKTIADLIEDRFGLPTNAGRTMPADGPVAHLLRHCTHRWYTDRPVTDETIQIALAAALSAPAKSDLQQVAIILVKDKTKQATIAGWLPDTPIGRAPVFMVFCGDNRRLRRLFELRGRPFINDTLDMFMNAAVDAALVMGNFIAAAEGLGLGCCPISVIRDHAEKVSNLLALPPSVFPVAGLCVGYPQHGPRISMRLPMTVTVHTDRYDDSRMPDEVAGYDRRREAKAPTPKTGQRFPDRFGVADDYGWSEDKARQYSVPQRHDFGDFIRRHGFALK